MFRQHPGWFVFFAGLAALTVVTIPLCLRDPEYRAAFFFVAQLQNAGGQVVTGSDTDGVDRGHPPGRGRHPRWARGVAAIATVAPRPAIA